jgi:hypothetical protein
MLFTGATRARANRLRGHLGARRVMPLWRRSWLNSPRGVPTPSWAVGDRARRNSSACRRTVPGPRYRRNPRGAPRTRALKTSRLSTRTMGWGTATGTIRSWLASRKTRWTLRGVVPNGAVARSTGLPPRRDASQLPTSVDLNRTRLGSSEGVALSAASGLARLARPRQLIPWRPGHSKPEGAAVESGEELVAELAEAGGAPTNTVAWGTTTYFFSHASTDRMRRVLRMIQRHYFPHPPVRPPGSVQNLDQSLLMLRSLSERHRNVIRHPSNLQPLVRRDVV